MSRSGYYKWRTSEASEREKRKVMLTERVKWHFYDSDETYGSPRVRNGLVVEGWTVSERTVGLIMREHGLR
ncbi:IS3 family transposase [Paenibacillus lactis]|nr:IS3 family transposase [Paenibacillus lactis]